MPKTWAVMCGAIREELEVRLTMDKLLTMRQEGVLVGIIVSTWSGEFDRFPELRKQLEDNQVKIIEQSPLEKRVTLSRTNSINFMRQALQLQAALDCLPEDCFILKVRTDRALDHIKKIEPYLYNEPERISSTYHSFNGLSRRMSKIFDYKLTVLNAKMQRLFNFSDFVFWGYGADIRKLINFEIAELFVDRDLVANTQWFVYPFLEAFPIMRDYFRLINFRPLITGMKEYFEKEDASDYFPQFFYRVYASHLLILTHYFQLVDMAPPIEADIHYHFTDLFVDAREKGIVHGLLGSILLSDRVVQNFLHPNRCDGKESDGKFFEVLYSKGLFSAVTNQEFRELSAFRQKKGWDVQQQWLRERNWKEKLTETQTSSYQKNLLTVNFIGLNQKETDQLIEKLKTEDKIDHYLYDYWLSHPKLAGSSVEQMVFPYARTQQLDPLLIVSRVLRINGIQEETVRKSMQHLMQVSFDVRIQRKTVNVKTCQFMLNMILSNMKLQGEQFDAFYSDGRARYIFDRYLEKDEFDTIMQAKFSSRDLVCYLMNLSNNYQEKSRDIRALRLLELAMEIELSQASLEKLLEKYTELGNRNNRILTEKSLTLFEQR